MSSEAAYRELRRKTTASIRLDGIGSSHGHDDEDTNTRNFESLTYVDDESDVSRAHLAAEHYRHRGQFWNDGKHQTMIRYVMIIVIGLVQATVAYLTNVTTNYFVTNKFDRVNELIEAGSTVTAFFVFMSIQLAFASLAALFVWIEPVSAGSGIPEVKCYLNGIDLPRVGAPRTLFCKVLGVTCSVAAGLPVGKEGPMVHSGAVVATTVSSGQTRNDREKRDLVACGAAAGVCTAFSAPIGGILFALEEGASYWGPSNTWRTFFCSMVALMFLYVLNEIGSGFGKVGFNRLFSFGNFIFEGYQSSFSVYELFPFIMIGFFGGAIGAIFNNANERITHWRIKNVNYSKKRRFIEVLCVSSAVSVVTFALPWVWGHCTKIPDTIDFTADQLTLLEELVSFGCPEGHYNEIASLIFTEASVAIRQLFHLHHHAFRDSALIMFFFSYISMAVVVYGIAVPSGLFVPSLLSGAAFGRLFGNISLRLFPELAYSNTYALVGAAAVLGGMARMTISLTVILLECTGNEQYVLPLMLTLMTARITGGLFNDDLYHIHIHMKKGVQFLEAELRSVTRHHNLNARQIMSSNVVFVRPVERAGAIFDMLLSAPHSNFPVVDKDDSQILFGTISRHALCILLQKSAYGHPKSMDRVPSTVDSLAAGDDLFVPLVQWHEIEASYPRYPSIEGVHVADRSAWVDLRPYANTAPVTVQESASVERAYDIFRSLGLRFLPVVNRYNQIVGTLTRSDLTPEALAKALLGKGKKLR